MRGCNSIMDANFRYSFAGVLQELMPVQQIKWPVKAIGKKSFRMNVCAKGKCCPSGGQQSSQRIASDIERHGRHTKLLRHDVRQYRSWSHFNKKICFRGHTSSSL